MELVITPENETLNVVIKGVFTLVAAKQNFVEVLAAVKEHHAEKVLMDGRLITGEPTTMERFLYGEFSAGEVSKLESLLYAKTRFAYVLNYPVLDPGLFGETVAVNRGIKTRAFNNIEDARSWLDLPANRC